MNLLTLAVAGGRKTQSIVDGCAQAPCGRRILALTYTQKNQGGLVRRIDEIRPLNAQVEVQGWFSFLLGHWVRPYLPLKFAGKRLHGLNFEGDPGRYAEEESRFLDDSGRAYKRHLARLAVEINVASSGAVLDRLSRIYHEIYVDEVQDLNGYDLEVLAQLFDTQIDIRLVGDIRQAIILTNVHDPKNKQFKGVNIGKWFEKKRADGKLEIEHQSTTWRSNESIANFADTIFDNSWGFPPTTSVNTRSTGHDGVFAVATRHVYDYVELFKPLCLRYSEGCARDLYLPFMNIGVAKGMEVDRVLIAPTAKMLDFISRGTKLHERASCSMYVAVTRARSSVAIVSDSPQRLRLPVWAPTADGLSDRLF